MVPCFHCLAFVDMSPSKTPESTSVARTPSSFAADAGLRGQQEGLGTVHSPRSDSLWGHTISGFTTVLHCCDLPTWLPSCRSRSGLRPAERTFTSGLPTDLITLSAAGYCLGPEMLPHKVSLPRTQAPCESHFPLKEPQYLRHRAFRRNRDHHA